MKIKAKIDKKIKKLYEKFLLKSREEKFLSFQSPLKNDWIKTDLPLLITVAFNNPFVIAEQQRLVAKYSKTKINFLVLDNSSQIQKREEIKAVLKNTSTEYISLPTNPYKFTNCISCSHGLALNWCWKNIIEKEKIGVAAFFDHDFFPISPFSFEEVLSNQDFYGRLQQRKDVWYLWPGFMFLKTQPLFGKNIDFKPGKVLGEGTDTGGLLYESIFKNFNKDQLAFPKEESKQLRQGNDLQSDFYEVYDDKFIHTVNASYWKKTNPKEDLLKKLLSKY